MPTSARRRRNVDMGRLRAAMRGPGADTRVWLAAARVDDDPDAISWDTSLGWIVDVTFYGGPLDQEGPVPCRMGMPFAQDGATKSDPPSPDCQVLVAITDGDANSGPVIVGRIHNAGDCSPPATVNTYPIDEDEALATHIVVTPNGAQEQYGDDRQVSASNQTLEAEGTNQIASPAIWLGGSAATAATPAIPPIDFAVLGIPLVTALNTYAAALGAGAPAAPVTKAEAAAAATALATALTTVLSAKVALE